ncbi:MAG: hypothetical protein KC736_01590 [Candidatus Moranbacteria bacterium]|nr:hypothetical protein [Candidatus Moranbacteria bacterium]
MMLDMQKIRLLVHHDASLRVMSVVQKLGFVELTRVDNKELSRRQKSDFDLNHESALLDFAVAFLTPFFQPSDKVQYMLTGGRFITTHKNISQLWEKFDYSSVLSSVEKLQSSFYKNSASQKDVEAKRKQLLPWVGYPGLLDVPRQTRLTRTVFLLASSARSVSGNQDFAKMLLQILSSSGCVFHFVRVSPSAVVVTFLSGDASVFEKFFSDSVFDIVDLPVVSSSVSEALLSCDRDLQQLIRERSSLEKEVRLLARNLPQLQALSDDVYWKKSCHNVISGSWATHSVDVFEGWIPVSARDAFVKALKRVTPYFSLENIAPDDEEQPPVEIVNTKAVLPFESVTRLYGLPGSKDLDPTPYLVGFFLIFFGLCLTDVIYGIVLSTITGYVLWRYTVSKETKALLSVVFLGGIASFFIGLFFGGYAGIDMASMPSSLQFLQLFDPVKDPIAVFLLALSFGVVHILTGLVLGIMRQAQQGLLVDGLLSHGSWIVVLLSLVYFALEQAGIFGLAIGGSLVIGAFVFLVLAQGHREKTVVKKVLTGLVSLYDSVGYFSDLLSYSRLMALGLATSALAFAMNLVAELVSGVPYVGNVIAVLVLIVGHTFNIALNTLGAFIHSARLQFVEFFGKFIIDSGRVFAPFHREERHVIIRDDVS